MKFHVYLGYDMEKFLASKTDGPNPANPEDFIIETEEVCNSLTAHSFCKELGNDLKAIVLWEASD